MWKYRGAAFEYFCICVALNGLKAWRYVSVVLSFHMSNMFTDSIRRRRVARSGPTNPKRRVQRRSSVRRAARPGGVRGAAAARRAVPPGAPAARAGRVDRVHARRRAAAAPRAPPARPARADHTAQQELQRHGAQHCRCQGTCTLTTYRCSFHVFFK